MGEISSHRSETLRMVTASMVSHDVAQDLELTGPCGWAKSVRTTLKPWEAATLVGNYRGIIRNQVFYPFFFRAISLQREAKVEFDRFTGHHQSIDQLLIQGNSVTPATPSLAQQNH